MIFHAYHGRTKPGGPAQSLDKDGTPHDIDDWGFSGPKFEISAVIWTYGTMEFLFADEVRYQLAKAATGWPDGVRDYSLEPFFHEDLLRTFDPVYERFHYFGDWSID